MEFLKQVRKRALVPGKSGMSSYSVHRERHEFRLATQHAIHHMRALSGNMPTAKYSLCHHGVTHSEADSRNLARLSAYQHTAHIYERAQAYSGRIKVK